MSETNLNLLDLIVLAAATWYSAFVISSLDGPFHVFSTVRKQLPLGGMTGCRICLAPWCAVVLYVVYLTELRGIVLPLAIAGLALMAEAYTGVKHILSG